MMVVSDASQIWTTCSRELFRLAAKQQPTRVIAMKALAVVARARALIVGAPFEAALDACEREVRAWDPALESARAAECEAVLGLGGLM